MLYILDTSPSDWPPCSVVSLWRLLVLKQPPTIDAAHDLRCDERYKEAYWGRFKDMYFAGDGA